jgi:hypothetical protein
MDLSEFKFNHKSFLDNGTEIDGTEIGEIFDDIDM